MLVETAWHRLITKLFVLAAILALAGLLGVDPRITILCFLLLASFSCDDKISTIVVVSTLLTTSVGGLVLEGRLSSFETSFVSVYWPLLLFLGVFIGITGDWVRGGLSVLPVIFVYMLTIVVPMELLEKDIVVGLAGATLIPFCRVGKWWKYRTLAMLVFPSAYLGLLVYTYGIEKSGQLYTLLPETAEGTEAKYFKNYNDAMGVVGLSASPLHVGSMVEDGSVILIPWLTGELSSEAISFVHEILQKRKITVVLVGEHNNYNNFFEDVRIIVGRDIFLNDLTVPPGNSNYSQYLLISGIVSIPVSSTLNRGASLRLDNLADHPVAIGRSWHAEKDIAEWIWTGNYAYESWDRSGSLVLAARYAVGKGAVVAFGDSGPFLNSHFIENPRQLRAVLGKVRIADLYLGELVRIVFIVVLIVFGASGAWLLVGALVGLYIVYWNIDDYGEVRIEGLAGNPFSGESFAEPLVDLLPGFGDKHRIMRSQGALSLSELAKSKDAVLFGLPSEGNVSGRYRISDCWRVGGLTYKDYRIMDGAVCRVEGNIIEVFGDEERVVVFYDIENNNLIVLDQRALSGVAPIANRNLIQKWVSKYMGR